GDLLTAPVATNFEDLLEDDDDAVLRLNKTAVERNIVHSSLQEEEEEIRANPTRAYSLKRLKLEEEFRNAITVGGSGGRSERDGART
ncbi:hypothetical protein GOODEAATRI_030622, partial [Goodea atripinnis]